MKEGDVVQTSIPQADGKVALVHLLNKHPLRQAFKKHRRRKAIVIRPER
jgi:hypothetical protein